MTTKNFVVKNGITTGNITLDAASGNLSATNANLGNLLTANYFSGNGNALFNIQGANVTGTVPSATTAATVTTNAQPNITSVGTLTSLVVGNSTANVTLTDTNGNGFMTVTGNITAANFIGNIVGNISGNIVIPGSNTGVVFNDNGNANTSTAFTFDKVSNLVTITGTASVSGNANIGNIGTGGLVTATGNIGGGNINTGGLVTATGNITGGNLITGGLITATGNITGGNVTTTGALNGGTLSVTGTSNLGAVGNVTITGGSNGQVLTTNGSGGLSFVSISSSSISNGNSNVNIPSANGNVNISAVGTANVLVVTGTGANITGTLSVSGDATIGNIVSSGTGGNISGANVISANLFTGTLTTNAQPNITSTGTLTSLSVSGNANTGNLGTNNFIATGTGSFSANVNMNSQWINNVGYPNLETDAASKLYVDTLVSTGVSYHQPVNVATTTTLAVATGGTTAYNSPNGAANGIGAYISTTGTFLNIDSANVQTVGTRILVKDEANAAWNGVYTYANTTAIVRSTDTDEYGAGSTTLLSINDYFFTLGGVVNEGTAFIVSAPAGTITFGTSNIVFSTFSTSQVYDAGTGIAITGTTISANASQTQITAVGTLTSLSVSGNANVGNIGASAGVFTTIAGSLTTAAQPNITSTGTLSSLSVSGTTSLGAVGNVTITGGTNGQVLTTDGSNVLSWTTVSGGGSSASISNGTSNVNITTANGNINTSVNGVANVLVITGTGANIAGTLNVTGTIVPRVVAITDATSVTMNGDTTDIASQINTQAVGTLTVNAVTGTLVDGQKIIFRLKSTNVQTFSWNAVFQGSTELALPTTSTGSNQYDYMGFIYNSIAAKWQYMAKNFGF